MGLLSDQSWLVFALAAPFMHKTDLVSFQAVSKICHDVAMPHLYHELCLSARIGAGGSRRLYNLLRTLMCNSSLRPLVKHLSITEESSHKAAASEEDYAPDREIPQLSEADRAQLENAIVSMEPHWWERWISALAKDGPADLVIPLLLWHVPNLRTLYLDYWFHSFSPHLRKLMLHIANAMPVKHFTALEKVTYAATPTSSTQDVGVRSFEHIQALFCLPKIRNICIALDRRGFTEWPPALRDGKVPQATSLRTLQFARCESSIKALKMLALASPQLRSLDYVWWRDLDRAVDDCIFLADAFMDALATPKASLRKLSLRLDYCWQTFDIGSWAGYFGIEGHFKDFSGFENLQQLRVPLRLSLPAEIGPDFKLPKLPLLLETLILLRDGFDFNRHMSGANELLLALKSSFEDYRENYPRLQTIGIEAFDDMDQLHPHEELNSQIHKEIKALGFQVGTSFADDWA